MTADIRAVPPMTINSCPRCGEILRGDPPEPCTMCPELDQIFAGHPQLLEQDLEQRRRISAEQIARFQAKSDIEIQADLDRTVESQQRRKAREEAYTPSLTMSLDVLWLTGGEPLEKQVLVIEPPGIRYGTRLTEDSFFPVGSIDWIDVVSMQIDGPDPVHQVTKPRAALFGVFALAAKKEVKHAYLTFFTRFGTARTFEVPGVSRYELSAALIPVQHYLEQYPIDAEV